jgi:hypothetical protein
MSSLDSFESWNAFRRGERYTPSPRYKCWICKAECDGSNEDQDGDRICNLCVIIDELVGLRRDGKANDLVAIVRFNPLPNVSHTYDPAYAFLKADGTVMDTLGDGSPVTDYEIVEKL